MNERACAEAVATLLKRCPPGTVLTLQDVFERLPHVVSLQREDMRPIPSRPGERAFHNRVRNLRSHKSNTDLVRHLSTGFALPRKRG